MMNSFPPNSRTAAQTERKKVERVTTSAAIKRNKPLGQRFRETFFGGDAKSSMMYVLMDVLLPAAQDAIIEAGSQGIERLVKGDVAARRGRPASPAQNLGRFAYNQISQQSQQRQPRLASRDRSSQDFGEIILQSQTEAADVIDRMHDVISQYDSVTVADLYYMTGLPSTHVDQKWGWRDLTGSGVLRVRSGGYMLGLPDPEPLGR